MNTTSVVCSVSWRVGQTTLRSSTREPCTNCQKSRPCVDCSETKMPIASAASTIAQRSGQGQVAQHVEGSDASHQDRDGRRQLCGVQHAGTGFNLFGHFSRRVPPDRLPAVRSPGLAGQEGIEPPTCGFGDRRSAN